MATIKIEDIRKELSQDNWTLVTEIYTNLDSEMEFKCAEGHAVFSNWKRIRQKRTCPICESNLYKKTEKIISKKKDEYRILSIDQATHISGYAIFSNKKLIKYGAYTDSTDSDNEIERDTIIKQWAASMIENWRPDLVAIEGVQYDEKKGVATYATLCRLQGILMNLCQEIGMPYKVCAVNTWRAHCGVKGVKRTDKKRSMQLLAKKWYDISVTEDEADAIGIGKYASESFTPSVEVVDWE